MLHAVFEFNDDFQGCLFSKIISGRAGRVNIYELIHENLNTNPVNKHETGKCNKIVLCVAYGTMISVLLTRLCS
uniref:Uncharacterized protein n=1 Tax=Pararge aegeria TaxID=116150 RepID=S4P8F5_9NEOP